MHLALGDHESARAALDDAIAISQKLERREAEAAARELAASAYPDDAPERAAQLERAAALYEALGRREEAASARASLAQSYLSQGKYERARALLEGLLAALEPSARHQRLRAWAHDGLLAVCIARERLDEGYEHARLAARGYEALDDHVDQIRLLRWLGYYHHDRGEHDDATRHYRRALELLARHPSPRDELLARSGLANNLAAAEDYEAARPLFARALELAREVGDEDDQLACAVGTAACHNAREEFAAALTVLERAGELGRATDGSDGEQRYRAELGRTYRDLDRLDEATRALRRALALVDGDERPEEELDCCLALASLYYQQGDHATAIKFFERSLLRADAADIDLSDAFWDEEFELLRELAPRSRALRLRR
ncbi:MAG: tetratricopeptide repeat protein [Myxococcales bacterium]|nr:tetratricopeptide repeat protein [Myxococcales bacterium]